eukprot:gene9829-2022_t
MGAVEIEPGNIALKYYRGIEAFDALFAGSPLARSDVFPGSYQTITSPGFHEIEVFHYGQHIFLTAAKLNLSSDEVESSHDMEGVCQPVLSFLVAFDIVDTARDVSESIYDLAQKAMSTNDPNSLHAALDRCKEFGILVHTSTTRIVHVGLLNTCAFVVFQSGDVLCWKWDGHQRSWEELPSGSESQRLSRQGCTIQSCININDTFIWSEVDHTQNVTRLAMRLVLPSRGTQVFLTEIPTAHGVRLVPGNTEVFILIRPRCAARVGYTWLLVWSLTYRSLVIWINNVGTVPVQARLGGVQRQDIVPCYEYSSVRHAVMLSSASLPTVPAVFHTIEPCVLSKEVIILCSDGSILALTCPSVISGASLQVNSRQLAAIDRGFACKDEDCPTNNMSLFTQSSKPNIFGSTSLLFWKELSKTGHRIQLTSLSAHPVVCSILKDAFGIPGEGVFVLSPYDVLQQASHIRKTAGPKDSCQYTKQLNYPVLAARDAFLSLLNDRLASMQQLSHEEKQMLLNFILENVQSYAFPIAAIGDEPEFFLSLSDRVKDLIASFNNLSGSNGMDITAAVAALGRQSELTESLLPLQKEYVAAVDKYMEYLSSSDQQQQNITEADKKENKEATEGCSNAEIGESYTYLLSNQFKPISDILRYLLRAGTALRGDHENIDFHRMMLERMAEFNPAETLDAILEHIGVVGDVALFLFGETVGDNLSIKSLQPEYIDTLRLEETHPANYSSDSKLFNEIRPRLLVPFVNTIYPQNQLYLVSHVFQSCVTEALVVDIQRRRSTYRSDYARLYIRALNSLPSVPKFQHRPSPLYCDGINARVTMFLLPHTNLHLVEEACDLLLRCCMWEETFSFMENQAKNVPEVFQRVWERLTEIGEIRQYLHQLWQYRPSNFSTLNMLTFLMSMTPATEKRLFISDEDEETLRFGDIQPFLEEMIKIDCSHKPINE